MNENTQGKHSNLIDFVKRADRNSYNDWFDEWLEKLRPVEQIKEAAEKGYTGFSVQPQLASMKPYDYKPAEADRLADRRTVKRLKTLLGPGFEVEYIEERIPQKLAGIFNINDAIKRYIFVTWERAEDDM